MKLIFIRPYLSGEGYEPPAGIAFLAGYLRKYSNTDMEVLDLEVLKWGNKKVKEELEKRKPDIVCLSAFSYNRFDGFALAKISKEIGATVIFGGPHTTFIDVETLKDFPQVDIIVRGEAEKTFLEVINKLKSKKSLSKVKGITYHKKGKIYRNPNRELLDISELPMPAWDLFPMEKYSYHAVSGSRGCPYNCIFCGSPKFWQRKLRLRDPKHIVDEIEYLLTNYGNKIVHMKDDVFTADRKWVLAICHEIKKRNLKVTWECLTRVNLLEEGVLKEMRETGCQLLEFGVETGNAELMKKINKVIDKDQVVKGIEIAKKLGFKVGTFFMLGHPGETKETLKETSDFAIKLRGDAITFTLTDAIPGSQLYDYAKKSNCLPEDFSWSKNKLNLSGYSVPRFMNSDLPESLLMEYSRKFLMRFAFVRLFDMKDYRDTQYLFVDKYVPFHFIFRNSKDFQIFLNEFILGLKESPNIMQTTKGFIVLPYFLSRLVLNYVHKAYRKVFRPIKKQK